MPSNKRVPIDSDLALVLASSIDTSHPLPIYLQIASALEREVASGRLPIGTVLPSVRSLAATLGVHYHTVRHAWDTLVEGGVLSVRRGRGALIVCSPAPPGSWRLTPSGPSHAPVPTLWLVSTVWRHAAAIAHQLMDRWAVVAAPWPTTGPPPPPGAILLLDATPMPVSWSARQPDIHPLPTALASDAVSRIRRAANLLGTRIVQIVLTASLGDDAALLSRQLPRLGLTVGTGLPEEVVDRRDGEHALLVTDRGTGTLVSSGDPRVLLLDRVPAAGPLAGLSRELRWPSM